MSGPKLPAVNEYMVTGVFIVRMFAPSPLDTVGYVVPLRIARHVEATDDATAAQVAGHQLYNTLDAKGHEYDPLGWRAAPLVAFVREVRPETTVITTPQLSMFDMMEGL